MAPRNRRRRGLLAVPAIGYAILILAVASRPASDLPGTGVPSGDKVLHTIEYAIFGMLLLLPLRDFGWRGRGFALAIGTAYAAFDETLQSTVPGRFADAGDFVMDVVGLLLAVAVHLVVFPVPPTAKSS